VTTKDVPATLPDDLVGAGTAEEHVGRWTADESIVAPAAPVEAANETVAKSMAIGSSVP
jgi:hypothetical protein